MQVTLDMMQQVGDLQIEQIAQNKVKTDALQAMCDYIVGIATSMEGTVSDLSGRVQALEEQMNQIKGV